MAFEPGTKLGTYEILGLLGAGGMGEVYRARDAKLKREVAIKVLPDAFAGDAERIARFQREAEALAALNHPHIAAIYDFAEIDDSRLLILELVEGETLADRISHGPLPQEEALSVAKQIAEALAAAHEKGIVHRDLKPANIKLTAGGSVKILDFGLAKALAIDATPTNLSHSPTMSMAATNAGMILGTASYMSPEQAKGRLVDRRTDIFAFGCVLYEMLTGKRAFDGEDVAEIMGAVLKTEPDWSLLPAATPPGIRKLLVRCLQKNPTNRRADAGDIRMDIDEALAERVIEPVASTRERSTRPAWMVAALMTVAFLAVAIVHFRERAPVVPPETRLDIASAATGDPGSFALSPDGRQIVFVAFDNGSPRLLLRPLDRTTSVVLPGTDGAAYPFWSPDSRSIAFFADNKLKRIDIGGGSPVTLTNVAAGRGGTWSKDDVILFAPNVLGPLQRIAGSGGEPSNVPSLGASHRFPQFLPDSQQFLFYAQGSPDSAGIYLGSLASDLTKRLTPADTNGFYVPGGWLLWVRGTTLVAQRLDLERKELTGNVIPVADGISVDNGFYIGAFSVSNPGLIAYRVGNLSRRALGWFDRQANYWDGWECPMKITSTPHAFPRTVSA
jgi:eukaryotic-like serine/threonine-protein kinase